MTLVLDTGALRALDGDDRAMWVRLKGAMLDGDVPITHAGAFGQAWTLGGEQHRLELALAGIEIKALDACLLYTSPSPRDRTRSRMPSSA